MLAVRQTRPGAGLVVGLLLTLGADANEERLISLSADQAISAPVQTGDRIRVSPAVDPQRAWVLRVSRRGTQVELEIDGGERYSHPHDRFSSDYVYLPAGSAASTDIVLIAEERGGAPATLGLELVDARELPAVVSSVTEWTREGALAFAERDETGRLRALALFQRVERVLYAAEHPLLARMRADAIHAQGEIAYFLEDAALTTSKLRTAANEYEALSLSVDEAAVLNSLGLWYMSRRQRDAADAAFDEAAAATRNPILLGQIQYNRCLVPLNLQFLAEAESCLDEADALTTAANDDKMQLSVRYAQAGVHSMRGDASQALPILLEILENASAVPWYRRGNLYNNIALQYSRLGETPTALDYYQRALAANRRTNRPKEITLNLRNIGWQYFLFGDIDRARQYLHDAAALAESVGNTAEAVQAGTMLATIDRVTGNIDAAAGRLAALGKLDFDDPDRAGNIAVQQAYVALELGDLAGARAAVAITRQHYAAIEPNARSEARLLLAEAGIAERDGRLDEALDIVDSTIELYERLRDPVQLALGYGERARLALALGDLDAAERAAATAQRYFRPVRGRLASLDLRANWGAESAAFQDVLIDVAMRRHATDRDAGHDATALRHAISTRAQTLAETLDAAPGSPDGSNAALIQRRRDLLLEVSRFADADRAKTSQTPLPDLLFALDRLDQELARANPRRANLSGAEAPSLTSLRQTLGTDSALLTAYLGRSAGYVWLLDSTGLRSSRIDEPQMVRDAAIAVANGVRERRDIGPSLAVLSEALLPTLPAATVERLYVSVDAELSYVPLALLTLHDGVLATDRYAIVNVPTPAALGRHGPAPGTVATGRRATSFNDPVFETSDDRFRARHSLPDDGGTRASVLDSESWNRLPYTAREADVLRRIFGAERVEIHEGFAATRDAFVRRAGEPTDVLHLATHGIVNSERPELTGLMLSRYAENSAAIDGFVGTRDIYSFDLDATLVVLSACETALGREVRGEGLVGLARAFMYAGADQVIASLWQVSDSATARMMDVFYTDYAQHRDAARALQQARQVVRSDRRWRHPYYWAGFVLYGH